VHLLVAIVNQSEPDKALARFKQFNLPEPVVVRARSAAAALSADVPLFAGLRSLAPGADEDRLVLLCLLPVSSEEAQALVTRVQLEMDADDPPMGRLVAMPVMGSAIRP
jgi:hypothetical protein